MVEEVSGGSVPILALRPSSKRLRGRGAPFVRIVRSLRMYKAHKMSSRRRGEKAVRCEVTVSGLDIAGRVLVVVKSLRSVCGGQVVKRLALIPLIGGSLVVVAIGLFPLRRAVVCGALRQHYSVFRPFGY